MSNSPDILADRAHWLKRCKPFPAQHARIDYRRWFSAVEARKLVDGRIPREMDDRWFIAMQPGALDFYRSWTGYHVYRLMVRQTDSGVEAGPLLASRDDAQYRCQDEHYDVETVNMLIDRLLLRRE
jgi:hypothetical protein